MKIVPKEHKRALGANNSFSLSNVLFSEYYFVLSGGKNDTFFKIINWGENVIRYEETSLLKSDN